jgi:hypothetical protein
VTTARIGSLALLFLMTALPCPAAAQLVQAPPGSSRGVFGIGGPVESGSPGLALTINLDGGYDDNSLTVTDTAPEPVQPFESGFVTAASASLSYQRGQTDRYLLATGGGSVSHQQIAAGQDFYRLLRGEASLGAGTGLGQRSGLTIGGGVSYEPTYLFGAFDSLVRNQGVPNPIEDTVSPSADPTASLTTQRWLTNRVAAGAYRNWTSRQRMTLEYESVWIQPVAGPGLQSRTDTVALTHAWDFHPTNGIDLTYRFNRNAQTLADIIALPLETHSAEARYRHDRRLSPNRTLFFMLGAGVTAVGSRSPLDRSTFEDAVPMFSGLAGLRFLPNWGVSLSARRDITVLYGLSTQPFASDVAMLSVDGVAWRRLFMSASGGYSRGQAPGSAVGDYRQTMVNAQMSYGFGARVGLVAAYAYRTHTFRDLTEAPSSFPPQYGRHSVRVGLTMWLPLYGSY